ncbi:MAG: RidA family protein [bacterium]
MDTKIKFSSGAKWEDIVGYSRAIKIGNRILVSGTTSVEDGKIIGEGDFYIQTKTILQKIVNILAETGARSEDIVRTRMFVTDITKWEEVGKAHGEFFREIKPVTSMIEIKALIDPAMLVEIEAEAIIG